ncbi:hypothetical protein E2C01_009062 [Portunus trituberculatus]|uniref:Uncharacterized protein n=1 Tax=Portunus trituberculatus TaxID=210409 RepID=A0A5B7D2G3_PORTR|nr:hypothetical protein [Portunus trituberculatus]
MKNVCQQQQCHGGSRKGVAQCQAGSERDVVFGLLPLLYEDLHLEKVELYAMFIKFKTEFEVIVTVTKKELTV